MISARTALLPLAVAAAVALAGERPAAWGFEAHRLIADRAIDLLPAAIRPFFVKHRAFIAEHAIDPDLWRTAGWTEEPPQHFLDLDAFGAGAVRRPAARQGRGGRQVRQGDGAEERAAAVARRGDARQAGAGLHRRQGAAALREGQRQVPERGRGALHRRRARPVPRGHQLRRPADQPAWPALALRVAAVRALPGAAPRSVRFRSA